MSASYFDLLKYAATGQASPDMTYYDKMRASTLMGGVVQTLTGQPPLTFKADGTPLISWSMKGNGQQTGTPTPDNPVMPEFVGVRTGNLTSQVDITAENQSRVLNTSSGIVRALKALTPGAQYTISWKFTSTSTSGVRNEIRLYSGSQSLNVHIGNGDTFSLTAEVISNLTTVIAYFGNAGGTMADFMLNSGSTAKPYEPFGWAEKITCASVTTPLYLGEVSTTRRIKKLVLTGEETFSAPYGNSVFYASSSGIGIAAHIVYEILCTHFTRSETNFVTQMADKKVLLSSTSLYIRMDAATTVSDFKAYLASEYAAGHPVTVWYILATPETGIVNEPLCKISTYADELSSEDAAVTIPTANGQNVLTVDTPIQPSEMSITYRG